MTLYAWGFAGGLVAAVVIYAVPTITVVALTDDLSLSRRRILATTLLTVLLALAAGFVALIPDAITRGQAISLGLASQTILKGVASGVRDAVPPG